MFTILPHSLREWNPVRSKNIYDYQLVDRWCCGKITGGGYLQLLGSLKKQTLPQDLQITGILNHLET